MKNYDETISTVFDRIGQYKEKQKRKKETIVRTVTPLCCLCAIAVIGFAVWGQNQAPDAPQFTMEEPLSTTTPTASPPSLTEPTQAISSNKIIIHPMDNSIPNTMYIALWGDDFIPMNKDEMADYYGCNVFPEVPDDISLRRQHWGIYRRNQGTGEIYHDQIRQTYENADQSRGLVVETRKGRLPFFDFVFPLDEEENSIINGHEVTIGLSEYGYEVWFMYKDVGFFIFADGITEDELISIISSLII